MPGHEQIEELCRCPVCKATAQGIVLDAAYRLQRDFKPEDAHKLIERINGELAKFALN